MEHLKYFVNWFTCQNELSSHEIDRIRSTLQHILHELTDYYDGGH
jgi:hypothetical protein